MQPGTLAAYAPTALYADKSGEVAAPNINPANEAIQQATASYTFAMNVEVMRVYSQMMKTLSTSSLTCGRRDIDISDSNNTRLYSHASWPDLFRPSTSLILREVKTWMPATSAGMTATLMFMATNNHQIHTWRLP